MVSIIVEVEVGVDRMINDQREGVSDGFGESFRSIYNPFILILRILYTERGYTTLAVQSTPSSRK